jgi:hypothetical protein
MFCPGRRRGDRRKPRRTAPASRPVPPLPSPPGTIRGRSAAARLTRTSDNRSVEVMGKLDSTGKVLTATFSGSRITGGSLADGRDNLVYNGTNLLQAGTKGQTDETKCLWRLFGDLYGTASLTAADKTAFMAVLNSRRGQSNYCAYLDYDENGTIVNNDLAAFNLRYGSSL